MTLCPVPIFSNLMIIVINWEGVGIGGHWYLIYDPLSFSRMGTIFPLPIFSGVGNGTVT